MKRLVGGKEDVDLPPTCRGERLDCGTPTSPCVIADLTELLGDDGADDVVGAHRSSSWDDGACKSQPGRVRNGRSVARLAPVLDGADDHADCREDRQRLTGQLGDACYQLGVNDADIAVVSVLDDVVTKSVLHDADNVGVRALGPVLWRDCRIAEDDVGEVQTAP